MKKKFLYEISRLFHIEGIIFDLKNIKMKVEKSFTFQNSEKQDLLRMRINPSFYFPVKALLMKRINKNKDYEKINKRRSSRIK